MFSTANINPSKYVWIGPDPSSGRPSNHTGHSDCSGLSLNLRVIVPPVENIKHGWEQGHRCRGFPYLQLNELRLVWVESQQTGVQNADKQKMIYKISKK